MKSTVVQMEPFYSSYLFPDRPAVNFAIFQANRKTKLTVLKS